MWQLQVDFNCEEACSSHPWALAGAAPAAAWQPGLQAESSYQRWPVMQQQQARQAAPFGEKHKEGGLLHLHKLNRPRSVHQILPLLEQSLVLHALDVRNGGGCSGAGRLAPAAQRTSHDPGSMRVRYATLQ